MITVEMTIDEFLDLTVAIEERCKSLKANIEKMNSQDFLDKVFIDEFNKQIKILTNFQVKINSKFNVKFQDSSELDKALKTIDNR